VAEDAINCQVYGVVLIIQNYAGNEVVPVVTPKNGDCHEDCLLLPDIGRV
jgi:hypothetical protein